MMKNSRVSFRNQLKHYFETFRFDRAHITPVLLILSAVGITVSAILTHPPVWKILPLYVSLFIALQASKVSRLAPLIGAFNAILYAIVYFSYGLYGMAAYAFFFSSSMQFITFFRWKQHAYRKSVVLQKMSWKLRGALAVVFVAAFVVMNFVLSDAGSAYPILDNLSMLFGIVLSIIYIFAFMEYYYLQFVSHLVTFTLYFFMIPEHPEQWAYFFQTLYSFICVIFAFIEARKLWKLQHEIKANETEVPHEAEDRT